MDNKNHTINQSEKLKEKHLNDINLHLKIKEQEKIDKLNSEREYNAYLRRLIAEEQEKNHKMKQYKINSEREEYINYQMKKRLDEYRRIEQKERDKYLLGLNVDHEENYNMHKQHVGMLDEKMEKNAISHKLYLKNNNFDNNKISNMFKNLPNQNNILPGQNSISNNPINITNNSYNYENTFSKEYKQLTKSDFEKKNEEDLHKYKNKNVNNYNKNISENKYKECSNEERQISNLIRLEDLKRQDRIEEDLKQLKLNQQKIYKNTLDKQHSERMFYSPQPMKLKNYSFGGRTDNIDHSFLDKNILVSVAPYTMKKYEIGGTILDHNPIVNPVPDYKNNKYLYQHYSPFKYVGKGLIGK